ncbi:hypothetical protein AGR3A_Cc30004 [Agrobacterium tomkonis CFBP 6623]|uniref:Uncharacterized protein n=1 Tax=Agrobacterium tomkonis CFBP 6623 TaxID=1183432 RepID=A0A1S7PSX6_9HYPH|nr:hypothetical protein AGR3A_Cc30004 [Agrobacterium tomkonis CFBP 6623]
MCLDRSGTHIRVEQAGHSRSYRQERETQSIPDSAFRREREEDVHELYERRLSADEKPGWRHRDMWSDDHV